MADSNSHTQVALKCTHLRVHYIYTFLFTGFDIEGLWTESKRAHAPGNLRSMFLEKGGQAFDGAWIEWAGGEPLDGHGGDSEVGISFLDPYLHLRVPHVHLQPSNCMREDLVLQTVQKQGQKEKCMPPNEARLDCQVIVLDCGWGRAIYTLDVKPQSGTLSKENVIDICNLGLRKQYRVSSRENAARNDTLCPVRVCQKDSGDEVFLFSQFVQHVQAAKMSLERLLSSTKRPDRAISWGAGDGMEWIEVKRELVGGRCPHGDKEDPLRFHFQVPFPLIVMEVPQEQYDQAFSPSESEPGVVPGGRYVAAGTRDVRRSYHRDLLSILSRSREYDHPDPSFADRQLSAQQGILPNLCSTSRLFLQLHTRSCLAVSHQLNLARVKLGQGREVWSATEEPASYLLPVLLSTVGFLRMQWHSYAVAARWISETIREFGLRAVSLGEIIDRAIEIRRAVSLSIDDSVTYRVASGSLTALYAQGVEAFRIPELQRVVVEKVHLLDQLRREAEEAASRELLTKWGEEDFHTEPS